MRRAAFLCILSVVISVRANAQAGSDVCFPLSGDYLGMFTDTTDLRNGIASQAWVEFTGCSALGGHRSDNYSLKGTHRINSTTYSLIGSEPVTAGAYGYYLLWRGMLNVGGTPGACYTSYVDAIESLTAMSQGLAGDRVCLQSTCLSGAGSDRHALLLCEEDPTFTNWSDPIVIALDNAGSYRLSGFNDGVRFDLDADGVAEATAWTRGGDSVAFLALDRNGDGMINNGSELFGNKMSSAKNGFLALAELDGNNDGVIDANDAAWSKLLLWVDANHNGVSESYELQPIMGSRIAAINTTYHWTGRKDTAGNLYLNAGHALFDSGQRPIYDVWLTRLNSSTVQ